MIKKPGPIALAFIISTVVIYVGFIFLRNKTPVNYADKIEEFKAHGVPDFKLSNVQLADAHFKVALINFWATWCIPCKNEFPSLVKLSQHYKDNPNLKIYAVSEDRAPEEIKTFTADYGKWGPGFVILLDDHFQVANIYGTKKIPETYIIDGKFHLLRKVLSEQNWTSSEFIAFLDRLLQGSSN